MFQNQSLERTYLEKRVLILTKLVGDAEHTHRLLTNAQIPNERCKDIDDLCEKFQVGAAAVIVAKEAYLDKPSKRFSDLILSQPPWSHLPIILVVGPGDLRESKANINLIIDSLRNVTLLERPVHFATLLSIVRAVTDDRERQYETRELLDHLERSNESLSQFASIASHDLQEPLRMIISYLQMLQKHLDGKLDSNASEYFEFAIMGAKRLRVLISDLLSYAHEQSRTLECSQVSLTEVLREVRLSLKAKIEETGAQVVEETHLPAIWGDRTQIYQLLQNLISNGLKFRKPNVIPVVAIGATSESNQVKLWVKDNGIGIPSSEVPKIFQIFKRLHARSQYPGNGIGLAICKKIVERHNGRIWVESTENQGSTFCVSLPQSNAKDKLEAA